VKESAALVADEEMRALVTGLGAQVHARDSERLARLRRAVVHNDPNDYNVLVSLPPAFDSLSLAQAREGGSHEISNRHHVASAFRRKVTAILDFGDIVHAYAIADLAIAVAYAVLGKPDPLAAAVAVVRGYQEIRPLDEDEMGALFGLVLLRLCTSVCVAARQQRQRPDDPYLAVSQEPIARGAFSWLIITTSAGP